MKRTIITFFLLLVSVCITSGQVLGFDYTVRRDNPSRCATYQEVYQDLVILKKVSSEVRIYNMLDCDQGNYTLRAAKAVGLKVFIGFQNNPLLELQIQLNILAWLEDQYGVNDIITGAAVGTESIHRNDLPLATVVERIVFVKNWTRANGFTFPVGYADTTGAITGNKVLATVSDLLLINIFPYWEGTTVKSPTDTASADRIVTQFRRVQQAYPNTTIIIGETGWATNAGRDGQNGITTSEWYLKQAACRYFSEKIPFYWFEAFDQPWKGVNSREGTWGIFYNNRTSKFNLANWSCKDAPPTSTVSTYTYQPPGTYVSDTCRNMYASLNCRTTSEDISRLNATLVGDVINYVCGNYPEMCTDIGYAGQFQRCSGAQKASHVMNNFYLRFGQQLGDEISCDFQGLGSIVTSINPDPLSKDGACHAMFSLLSCRTLSEDTKDLNVTRVAATLDYLCSQNPLYCRQIESRDGTYGRCNAAQKVAYTMNQYYVDHKDQLGDAACDFDGLGVIPALGNLPPPTSENSSCHIMFTHLSCRTPTENTTKLNLTKLGDAVDYICSQNGDYCKEISKNGIYYRCNQAQQASWVMDKFYAQYGPTQGEGACDFGGLGVPQKSLLPDPLGPDSVCHLMYADLACRTTSERVDQSNATILGNSLAYLCSQKPSYCTELNAQGKYYRCNEAQRTSYAMNQFYLEFGVQQGDGACYFDGIGQIKKSIVPAVEPSPLSNDHPCHLMYQDTICRTNSEDPSVVNATEVGDVLNYLCSTKPLYCLELNTGGSYGKCTTAQKASYAMNLFYAQFGFDQGDAACYFNGLGRVVKTVNTWTSSVSEPQSYGGSDSQEGTTNPITKTEEGSNLVGT
ncbi:glucan beta-glucosidase Bgl2 (predicted) [Planoprotostelium fungivorum]|uniref:glucan endo-1,3-beta-D-glucosidase n=1 Tax=Planoprotostelium fungivorum TaxID=1890364 RepID=A0A2P6MXU7_9EUKA|nr:glucan beta-glucosidase Bgl2 (predicted) [Planoprotostelium fungivorum]